MYENKFLDGDGLIRVWGKILALLLDKQDVLIGSGTGQNIKTVNGNDILGNGNISITASGINAIPTSEKGAANGVAELDSNGKVPSAQLPSYVDDVVEYASMSNFPATGESGKIYIALDTNKTYRWGGSAYVEISESLALGDTSSTAYRGDRGKTAYDHSQVNDGSNPHNTTFANIASKPTTIAGYGITDAFSGSYNDLTDKPTIPDITIVEKTYAQLSAMVSGGTLVKGQKYRITDYATTTNSTDNLSTDTYTAVNAHAFDLVVTAIDTNKLDCMAQALPHSGDSYFSTAGADLTKWQVWYDINNDTTKYTWAKSSGGKGVIYRLIDEWGNDCPYDFKNIQFKRKLTDGVLDEESGTNTWVYTFNLYDQENSAQYDASVSQFVIENGEGGYFHTYGNVIKRYGYLQDENTGDTSYGYPYQLNDIVFCNYRENNGYFRGCSHNTFGDECYSCTFGNECQSNTFGNECQSNTFGDYCGSNTFGDYCGSNTFGDGCSSNTFGDNCQYIIFGNSSTPSAGGTYCRYNVIENGNQYIRLYQTSGTAGNNNQLQNVYIAQGVNNTTTWLDISTIARNLSYRTTVARLSDGTIRIYREDEDDMFPSLTGNAGKILAVNSGATGVEWITPTSSLEGLSDTTITTPSNGQILTYNTTTSKWVNSNAPSGTLPSQTGNTGKFLTTDGTDASWSDISHDIAHDSNQSVSSPVTVTFAANHRGSKMITVSANVNVTLAVNNLSDNYLWVKNSGSSAIDVTIASISNSTLGTITNMYLPADGISVEGGKVCEIGIVVNADGAFITCRNDLELTTLS